MSIDSENHDPEFVREANGKLIFGGAIFGMALFICAIGALLIFGVPGGMPGPQQQAASQQVPASTQR